MREGYLEPASMGDIRLIALDLDGTLLNSDKELSPRNRAALFRAAEAGIEIVPATGRFYRGMPEVIRSLPFVRRVITINGAQVLDTRTGETIYAAEIPAEEAVSICAYLDTLPVLYDCYQGGWGYMTEAMQTAAADTALDRHFVQMIRTLRTPVPELKEYLREKGQGVQKLQFFIQDAPLRESLLQSLGRRFPRISVTSAAPVNVEINHENANKGAALSALAARLGISRAQTMAFGDGLNDLSMIAAAGIGVAMDNAQPEVRAAASMITENCDRDGVAAVIEALLEGC